MKVSHAISRMTQQAAAGSHPDSAARFKRNLLRTQCKQHAGWSTVGSARSTSSR
jgi:hypothetical protein